MNSCCLYDYNLWPIIDGDNSDSIDKNELTLLVEQIAVIKAAGVHDEHDHDKDDDKD
jgi:hypothetical protein